MALPGWVMGVRFGMASAVISAVVILMSMRPLSRFRFTIIAALLTIALVDSLADGYALMNAAIKHNGEDGGATAAVARSASSAASSIVAKVFVCGSLAVLVWLTSKRAATAAGRKVSPAVVYAVAAAFAAAQIVLTAVTTTREDRLQQMALLAGLFVVAVFLSLLLRRLLGAIAA